MLHFFAILMVQGKGGAAASPVFFVVFPLSAAYSLASLQGPKLGPFVLTNVTTCKLFLAQKSSLRDLIFGLVSPARTRTRAGALLPPTPPKPAGASP